MNKELNILLSEEYTQKDFFRNSVYNSFIILRHIIKDYFKYFLFNITPLSRYEYWCFIIIISLFILLFGSVLALVYYTLPYVKVYLDILFYTYLFFVLNIVIRATSGRLLSLNMYINSVESVYNTNKIYFLIEKSVKDFFLSTKVYITAAFIKITFLYLYIINTKFIHDSESIIYIREFYNYPSISLLVFVLKIMTFIYIIFMVSPSISSEEYLITKNIPHYKVSYYDTGYSKEIFVDNLTLLAGIFAVIATGHILIIGYSLSLHIILSIAIVLQCTALIISGKFLSILLGIVGFIILIAPSLYLTGDGIEHSFYHPETIMLLVKYYQIVTAVLFIGVFYYISFDKDILKIISVLGFYISALFIWEDSIAVKSLIMYDTKSLSVLFYGLLELCFFFMFLIRVANEKGFNRIEIYYFAKLWNEFRSFVNLIQLKYIYTILFISSLLMAVYAFTVSILPIFVVDDLSKFLNNHISILFFDFRKFIALYILLSVYLIFKNYSDIFPMFLTAFVATLETYIIIYPSLSSLIPSINEYTYTYSYMYVYGLMMILSISLLKYSTLIAYGFGLSVVPFIYTLISIFTDLTFRNNFIMYNILFLSIGIGNLLIAAGAYRQLRYELKKEI